MLYLVSGTFNDPSLLARPREEFMVLVQKTVLPSLHAIVQLQAEGKIVAGGVPAGSQNVVMVVNLPTQDSHLGVRHLLNTLPIFGYYRWEVTPLETFQEWLGLFKG